jgi:hypothetical protein
MDGRVHNVDDPSQRLTNVSGTNQASPDARPWTSDGRRLAVVEPGELCIYELGDTAALTKEIPIEGDFISILRWLGSDTLLLEGSDSNAAWLALVDLSGEVRIVSDSLETAIATYHSAAPDGSVLYYSGANLDGEGYALYRVLPQDSAPSPELVATYNPSPMLDGSWSSDSRWFSFGISGEPDNGIYVWRNGGDELPKRVSPPGGGYTPFHYFSASGDHLAMQLADQQGVELSAVSLGDTAPSAPVSISTSDGVSPPFWAREGDRLAYSDAASGWVFTAGGGDGDSVKVDGYLWACPAAWSLDSAIVYSDCAGSTSTFHANVAQSPAVFMSSMPPRTVPKLGPMKFCDISASLEEPQDRGAGRLRSRHERAHAPTLGLHGCGVDQLQPAAGHRLCPRGEPSSARATRGSEAPSH